MPSHERDLKPINEQVVVVTGASSGLGRATALECARRGAAVVATARDQQALDDVVAIATARGGRAIAYAADIAEPDAMERVARAAIEHFGRIDTWVNDAAVSVYGLCDELPLDELRRVMDVNFYGQVYGTRAALPHVEREGRGAIICIGSALSDRAVPYQGAYCASKHALKGWVESLRVELAMRDSGTQLTLIKPSSMNTPFFETARTHLGRQPAPVGPVYEPEVGARAIIHCAEHRVREMAVGSGSTMLTAMESFAGPVLDWFFTRNPRMQSTDEAKSEGAPDNLDTPVEGAHDVSGRFPGRSFSVVTAMQMRPRLAAGAIAGAVGLSRVAASRVRRRRRDT